MRRIATIMFAILLAGCANQLAIRQAQLAPLVGRSGAVKDAGRTAAVSRPASLADALARRGPRSTGVTAAGMHGFADATLTEFGIEAGSSWRKVDART